MTSLKRWYARLCVRTCELDTIRFPRIRFFPLAIKLVTFLLPQIRTNIKELIVKIGSTLLLMDCCCHCPFAVVDVYVAVILSCPLHIHCDDCQNLLCSLHTAFVAVFAFRSLSLADQLINCCQPPHHCRSLDIISTSLASQHYRISRRSNAIDTVIVRWLLLLHSLKMRCYCFDCIELCDYIKHKILLLYYYLTAVDMLVAAICQCQ